MASTEGKGLQTTGGKVGAIWSECPQEMAATYTVRRQTNHTYSTRFGHGTNLHTDSASFPGVISFEPKNLIPFSHPPPARTRDLPHRIMCYIHYEVKYMLFQGSQKVVDMYSRNGHQLVSSCTHHTYHGLMGHFRF